MSEEQSRALDRELARFVAQSPIRRRTIVELVAAWSRSLPGGTDVLDVGAGTAPYRSLFGHCRYRTHDWENSVHPGEADLSGDLERGLPARDGEFGAVLCTEVLEHTADPRRALAEIRRILRPGGTLALSVPFVVPLHEEPYDFWRPTSHGLRLVLEQAGFTSVDVEPMSGWFGTVGEALHDYAFATVPPELPPSVGQRCVIQCAKLSSRVLVRWAPHLDRLDRRRALPLGWTAVAT